MNGITRSELFSVYNALRAWAKRNPEILDPKRVDRALGILQSKTYYTGDRELYHPSVEDCGCKDSQYWFSAKRKNGNGDSYRGACKHSIAEYLVWLVMRRREEHNVTEMIYSRVPVMAHH